MTQQKINIKLLPVKAHYFFFNAAGSALWPFLPVIGKQMGISADAIGMVFAAAPLTGCAAKPFFGFVADRLKKRKNTFLFFLLLALTSSLALGFLPQVQPQRPVSFECGNLGTNYIAQRIRHPSIIDDEHEAASLHKIRQKQNSSVQDPVNKQLRPGEELCHVKCEIHTFVEGSDFCYNLNMTNESGLPERCKGKLARHNEQRKSTLSYEIDALPTTLQVSYPYMSQSSTLDPVVAVQPYTIKFDVVLKMESTVLLNGSLFLHIDRLSFYPKDGEFYQFSCYPDQSVLTTCYMDCPSHPELNSLLERVLEESDFSESSSFWLYAVLVVLASTTLAVSASLSDALCFQILGDKPHKYGVQRQWGAIGWGIFTLVAGYFIDTNSKGKLLKDYTPCFYILAVLFPLDILCVYKWDVREVDKPKQIRRDLWVLVTDLRIIIFGFACMIVGMCTGMHWNFLFWHIEDLAANDRDWIKVLQGVMVSVQCFSELPFFHFGGYIIKKLGYIHCMTLVLFAFGVRFLLYSMITSPVAFIPVEISNGITFGLFYTLMASYSCFISPKGAGSMVQGIFGGIFEGIGVALGNLIGGIIMFTWGGSTAFRLFGLGALIFCFLHAVLTFFLIRMRNYVGDGCQQEGEEGQEMYKVNGVSQEVDAESE